MKYDIELVSYNPRQLTQAIAIIRKLSHCDIITARNYLTNMPVVILTDVDANLADEIRLECEVAGISVNLIKTESTTPYVPEIHTDLTQNCNTVQSGDNERDIMIKLWCNYCDYNNAVAAINDEIKIKKQESASLEKEIAKMQKNIDDNKRIQATNGGWLPLNVRKLRLIAFPEFNIVKWMFVASAIVSFVVMLILVGTTPNTVETWAKMLNFNAGAMIWLGAPILGVAITLLYILGYMLFSAINNQRKNKSMKPQRTKVIEDANKFFENINSVLAEKSQKESALEMSNARITQLTSYKNNLPPVKNSVPMPDELKSAEGVALLIQYIDTGRAYTIKEAVNLYFQDVKDAKKMEELRKQTAYAQEQMLNSRIAAENSYMILEEQKKTTAAAERGADAAKEAAYWNKLSFISDQLKK